MFGVTALPVGNDNIIASLRVRLVLQTSSRTDCPLAYRRNTLSLLEKGEALKDGL